MLSGRLRVRGLFGLHLAQAVLEQLPERPRVIGMRSGVIVIDILLEILLRALVNKSFN